MDLDQELVAALSVRPSPEFMARLRAHVARSQPPANASFFPAVAVAASAAVIVTVAATIGLDSRRPASGSIGKAMLPQTAAAAASPSQPVRHPTANVPQSVPTRVAVAEVLVSGRDGEAMRELFDAVQTASVDLTTLVGNTSYSIVDQSLHGEVVPPILVEPVEPIAIPEGARQ